MGILMIPQKADIRSRSGQRISIEDSTWLSTKKRDCVLERVYKGLKNYSIVPRDGIADAGLPFLGFTVYHQAPLPTPRGSQAPIALRDGK